MNDLDRIKRLRQAMNQTQDLSKSVWQAKTEKMKALENFGKFNKNETLRVLPIVNNF